jgi:hypothetical protein
VDSPGEAKKSREAKPQRKPKNEACMTSDHAGSAGFVSIRIPTRFSASNGKDLEDSLSRPVAAEPKYGLKEELNHRTSCLSAWLTVGAISDVGAADICLHHLVGCLLRHQRESRSTICHGANHGYERAGESEGATTRGHDNDHDNQCHKCRCPKTAPKIRPTKEPEGKRECCQPRKSSPY